MNKAVKISVISIIVLMIVGFAGWEVLKSSTRKHSPLDVAELRSGDLEIDVTYCQPYKKGRLIFGEAAEGALQPYGNYWRLGANEATTFKVNRDVLFANKPLKKGEYTMYAIPGEDMWVIAVNAATGQWGAWEPNYDEDVLRVEVPVEYTNDIVEQLTIGFEPNAGTMYMVIKWDTAVARVPID